MSRSYAYDKVTMLNAAYDVLEMLDANVQQINSSHGLILLRTDSDTIIRMIFEMKYPEKDTEVSFANLAGAKELGEEEKAYANVILDEMNTKLRMCY